MTRGDRGCETGRVGQAPAEGEVCMRYVRDLNVRNIASRIDRCVVRLRQDHCKALMSDESLLPNRIFENRDGDVHRRDSLGKFDRSSSCIKITGGRAVVVLCGARHCCGTGQPVRSAHRRPIFAHATHRHNCTRALFEWTKARCLEVERGRCGYFARARPSDGIRANEPCLHRTVDRAAIATHLSTVVTALGRGA